mmetsp:Transcript_80891/g.225096  ORF Transcript_80891/g.225096 Transcript_80891/m.225096 type:complete len:321 (+) Transcript_80891:647-1609(+)
MNPSTPTEHWLRCRWPLPRASPHPLLRRGPLAPLPQSLIAPKHGLSRQRLHCGTSSALHRNRPSTPPDDQVLAQWHAADGPSMHPRARWARSSPRPRWALRLASRQRQNHALRSLRGHALRPRRSPWSQRPQPPPSPHTPREAPCYRPVLSLRTSCLPSRSLGLMCPPCWRAAQQPASAVAVPCDGTRHPRNRWHRVRLCRFLGQRAGPLPCQASSWQPQAQPRLPGDQPRAAPCVPRRTFHPLCWHCCCYCWSCHCCCCCECTGRRRLPCWQHSQHPTLQLACASATLVHLAMRHLCPAQQSLAFRAATTSTATAPHRQ